MRLNFSGTRIWSGVPANPPMKADEARERPLGTCVPPEDATDLAASRRVATWLPRPPSPGGTRRNRAGIVTWRKVCKSAPHHGFPISFLQVQSLPPLPVTKRFDYVPLRAR